MGPMKPGNRLMIQARCQFPQDIYILKDEDKTGTHLSDGFF
jgi:hypothetical protein